MHQKVGDMKAAEAILTRLVRIDPDDHMHWLNLGLFYGDTLKYDKALEAYQKALDACDDPDWVEPYKMMGYIYSKRDEPEIAEKYFVKYLEKNPDSFEGHFQYGAHLLGVGRAEEGAEHFLRCVELDPMKIAAMRELSLAYRRARRPVEADQWLTLFRLMEVPEAVSARSGYPEDEKREGER
jgi:tetratricopeptide (TPR) repeat protein